MEERERVEDVRWRKLPSSYFYCTLLDSTVYLQNGVRNSRSSKQEHRHAPLRRETSWASCLVHPLNHGKINKFSPVKKVKYIYKKEKGDGRFFLLLLRSLTFYITAPRPFNDVAVYTHQLSRSLSFFFTHIYNVRRINEHIYRAKWGSIVGNIIIIRAGLSGMVHIYCCTMASPRASSSYWLLLLSCCLALSSPSCQREVMDPSDNKRLGVLLFPSILKSFWALHSFFLLFFLLCTII